MRRITVPPARAGSWEDLLHRAGLRDGHLLFDRPLSGEWYEPRGHRAIGVVYHPDRERYGNYVPAVLPRRSDVFLYLDRTEVLRPLHPVEIEPQEVPETYPFGVQGPDRRTRRETNALP